MTKLQILCAYLPYGVRVVRNGHQLKIWQLVPYGVGPTEGYVSIHIDEMLDQEQYILCLRPMEDFKNEDLLEVGSWLCANSSTFDGIAKAGEWAKAVSRIPVDEMPSLMVRWFLFHHYNIFGLEDFVDLKTLE